jgi:hypothetical protein
MTEAEMADEKPKGPGNAKPISLYGMTLEEAVRRAVNTPPPPKPENNRQRASNRAVNKPRKPK